MKNQYIELLHRQVAKLEDQDFDLEAWKSGTIAVLSSVFGATDSRATQIDQLRIDYSSWALRDSNSNYKPIESAKKKGKEILMSAIDEIEIFGSNKGNATSIIDQELSDEIKNMSDTEKKKHFSSMKKEKLIDLLMKVTQS